MNEKQISVESFQGYIDMMVRQIRDSHEKKEEALDSRLRELKATIRDMVQKHENLSSAYRYAQVYILTLLVYLSSQTKNGTMFLYVSFRPIHVFDRNILTCKTTRSARLSLSVHLIFQSGICGGKGIELCES